MTAFNTLGSFSTSFTLIAFPTVLKEFPHMLSTCWLLFLHSAVQLIPNHLNWVGWLWRPGHLMQYFITLLHGQIALTQPGGMLGHCPVEKQMIVPLSSLATLNYATLFTYPTLLISYIYIYTVLDTIYCILPMPLCTITHSYIFMYILFIPLHLCV